MLSYQQAVGSKDTGRQQKVTSYKCVTEAIGEIWIILLYLLSPERTSEYEDDIDENDGCTDEGRFLPVCLLLALKTILW